MQTAENRDKYHQLRVAAYCRVSTEQEEQQNSYQVQIAYYTDLINRKKEWTLAGIFADEGISGTQTKKRTEFNRMIRMCKNKKIDLVITKSISRFARNAVDCLEYVRQLKDLGIGVIFEKENLNTLTMTSEFMIALYGSFAQAESESISKNVSWGKEKAYREGRVTFQYKYLLGYKKGVDGTDVVHTVHRAALADMPDRIAAPPAADMQKRRMRHIRFRRRSAYETKSAGCEVHIHKRIRKESFRPAGGVFSDLSFPHPCLLLCPMPRSNY